MTEAFKVLGINGSLRKDSFNRKLLQAAQTLAPEGMALEILELHGIPPFDQDEEKQPGPKVVELKAKVRAADALLFATPEYNFSVPGVLKNAIDWGSRPFGDSCFVKKPGAIIGASIGAMGSVRAQLHLRQICVGINMRILNQPEVILGAAHKQFDASGVLSDETAKKLLKSLLEALIVFARSAPA